MTFSASRVLYLAAMLVTGLVVGFIVQGRPHLSEAVVAPVVWPFFVSLAIDLAIWQAVAKGKAEPLTMGDRFLGVIGAGLIVTLFMMR